MLQSLKLSYWPALKMEVVERWAAVFEKHKSLNVNVQVYRADPSMALEFSESLIELFSKVGIVAGINTEYIGTYGFNNRDGIGIALVGDSRNPFLHDLQKMFREQEYYYQLSYTNLASQAPDSTVNYHVEIYIYKRAAMEKTVQ